MHYVNDINHVLKMGQIIKVQRTVSSAPINGLYQRPLCDIRGCIYNSFAGVIIVQLILNAQRSYCLIEVVTKAGLTVDCTQFDNPSFNTNYCMTYLHVINTDISYSYDT